MTTTSRPTTAIVTLLSAIAITAGCDRRDASAPPAVSTRPQSNPPFSLVGNLNGKRADMLNKDGLDPAAPDRLDTILSTIHHGNAASLRRTPAVLTATMAVAVDVPGADGLWVHAVGPATQPQRIELLDVSGDVLATTDTFMNTTTTDRSLGLARVDCLAYVIPSTWNPRTPDQAAENVQFKYEGKTRPLILTHDQVIHPLFARLVYADGPVSDTVPVFHSPPPPPLTEALATARVNATNRSDGTDAAGSPSTMVKRIDAIVAAIHDDARSPRANPRLISAMVDDQPEFSPGTSLLELRAVGPSDQPPRVEILDEYGGVIATYEGRTGTYYEAVDSRSGTALLSVNLYVIPSIRDPLPKEKIVAAARKARMKLGVDNVSDLSDLVQLPSDWHDRPLTARLVFGNGVTTNAVPIYDTPQLY